MYIGVKVLSHTYVLFSRAITKQYNAINYMVFSQRNAWQFNLYNIATCVGNHKKVYCNT